MWTFTVILFSLLGVNTVISATADDGPIVHTKYGALKGEFMRAKGKDTIVHSYLGVPFAKPPVGPLRLSAPQPAEQWQGVRDATKQPYMCMQNRELTVSFISNSHSMTVDVPQVSEDCLYLNIYTPAKPNKDAKLPVMVWIHGGGFSVGSAYMFDGHALAAYQNVVVVLIQYRLGLFGFFSTGDEHAPGNYGLLDQVAALQWVQENIHSFGGDPGLVTIFGQSAGGSSVSYHILSPLSAGLFRYAIAESGTAAIDPFFTDSPLSVAQPVAKAFGCDTSSTKQIVDCIMQLSQEDYLSVNQKEEFHFKVTKDGRFLSKSVDELLQNKEFSKVPFITGVNNDEGGFILLNFLVPQGWTEGVDREQVSSLLPKILMYPDLGGKWLYEIVANEYLGTTHDRIKVRDALREICGDFWFNIPALKVAKHHKDSGAPVYMYEFQHTFNEHQKKRLSFVGSDHGDEFLFVFGGCFANGHLKPNGQFTEEEDELCRTIMAYWGNFARTGSPNGPGLTPWPEFGAEAEYLSIGLEQKPGKNLERKHYAFITQTLPRLKHETKDDPIVQIKYGTLKGERVTAIGKDTVVYSYLGVPFAKPPVGPLRFTAPQPAEQWQGIKDATKQPYMCIQNRKATIDLFANETLNTEVPEVSEDCLYLNIYTPAKPGENTKLPVMVWIHGGGLSIGSASTYDGSVLSAYQNVVVVLIQYRLGLFGFFSTGDEHAPGNYGLLDQVAALQWVQENIHSFGGDPGSVTIFGESAGGASVSFLLLSPLSTGLFHRAIAESGTATMKGIVGNPLPVAQLLANRSGCDISSTQKIAQCIKRWSTEDAIALSKETLFQRFVVTVDKTFLPKPVEELLQNQEFHKVPLMTGLTNDEFGWLMPNFLAPSGWMDGMNKEQILASMTPFTSETHPQWINELLVEEYLGSTADPIKNRDGYKELMADMIFLIPTLTLAKAHKAGGAPVYLYEFQQAPSIFQANRPSFVGADHTDELVFVFGLCFGNAHVKATTSLTKKENELCRTVMAYWGNFARTGSPNGPGLTPWPEFGAEAEYLGIGLDQKPGKNLKKERYIFMTEKLPELVAAAQTNTEHVEL
ncbi:liver carboxylesterase-like [Clarias gariepinus]|uniref:liver carboxylesterase-like n=1 Tax=Clarias gariepinus TaxID=13013 RepID=UPI00234CE010|nr:liver carboxylesterase-like [Clarias gariepinus]